VEDPVVDLHLLDWTDHGHRLIVQVSNAACARRGTWVAGGGHPLMDSSRMVEPGAAFECAT
jgi:hypothetical protein